MLQIFTSCRKIKERNISVEINSSRKYICGRGTVIYIWVCGRYPLVCIFDGLVVKWC
uniref:Uncharacterized protein n=1 Tax=Octopus bimaculoides TaxID=37653 RepID=A0A0L8I6Z9_OCTBM